MKASFRGKKDKSNQNRRSIAVKLRARRIKRLQKFMYRLINNYK